MQILINLVQWEQEVEQKLYMFLQLLWISLSWTRAFMNGYLQNKLTTVSRPTIYYVFEVLVYGKPGILNEGEKFSSA